MRKIEEDWQFQLMKAEVEKKLAVVKEWMKDQEEEDIYIFDCKSDRDPSVGLIEEADLMSCWFLDSMFVSWLSRLNSVQFRTYKSESEAKEDLISDTQTLFEADGWVNQVVIDEMGRDGYFTSLGHATICNRYHNMLGSGQFQARLDSTGKLQVRFPDVNGYKRDENGNYYPDPEACIYSDFESDPHYCGTDWLSISDMISHLTELGGFSIAG